MICKKCKQEIPDSVKECPFCGEKIDDYEELVNRKLFLEFRTTRIWAVAACVMAAISAIVSVPAMILAIKCFDMLDKVKALSGMLGR